MKQCWKLEQLVAYLIVYLWFLLVVNKLIYKWLVHLFYFKLVWLHSYEYFCKVYLIFVRIHICYCLCFTWMMAVYYCQDFLVYGNSIVFGDPLLDNIGWKVISTFLAYVKGNWEHYGPAFIIIIFIIKNPFGTVDS